MKKTLQLNIRVDEVDLARLRQLAKTNEITASQMLRRLIKEASEAATPG